MTFDPIPDKDTRAWLKYIEKEYRTKGRPPSIREIQKKFSISSTSVVNYRLEKMEHEGYLNREPYVARGLKLTDHGKRFMERR